MEEQQYKSHNVFQQSLQAGPNKTYGFDIRQVPSGKKYLLITENRLGEIRKFRNSLVVFPDYIDEFCGILNIIREKIN